jgi:hypothetical protein
MKKMLAGWMTVLAVMAVGGLAVVGPAAADGQVPIACDATALTHAFENGGSYVFGADCTLSLSAAFTLHSATTLSLDAGGHQVVFQGTDGGGNGAGGGFGNGNRFAEVAGTFDLYGITLDSFGVGGVTLDGTAGADGADGLYPTANDQPGGNGGDGGMGTNGGDAHGGALLIDPGANVTLTGVTLSNDFAHGGKGGNGGNGGNGTFGAGGAPGSGIGAPGGNGGNGGQGGNGGDAYGGAIENDGTLALVDGTVVGDIAEGGVSQGGNGGDGGEGGVGGIAEPEQVEGTGGVGGAGGNGGSPGHTGAAYGGAIYNAGALTVTNTFFNNDSVGYTATSFGGRGGYGGKGGPGQWDIYSTDPTRSGSGPGNGGDGGPGGNGAPAGTIGITVGGDIYSTSAYALSGGQAHGLAYPETSCWGGGELGGRAGGYLTSTISDGKVPTSLGHAGATGTPTGNAPCDKGQASGDTFFPDPNPGGDPGSGESGSGGGGGSDGGGAGSGGSGEAGSGGSGSGGSGSTDTGSGKLGPGSSGSGSGSSGSGSGGKGSGGGGSGGGGHAVLGKLAGTGTTASVPVECPASGPSCAITAELTESGGPQGKPQDAAASDRRLLKAVVLGRATATVRPGHSTTLKVTVGARGRRLLAAHHQLKAQLTVYQRVGGRQTVLRSAAVRFKQ